MLLPVHGKLLPEMLQQIDRIRVDTPGLTVPYGSILLAGATGVSGSLPGGTARPVSGKYQ
ncbi:MAG TPA: hypothetical protein VIH59_07440 [Candidatus Tectomicrobia bacterium]|jgi:hypothetical protein